MEIIKKSLKKILITWKNEFPEILHIYIFGSFVRGDYTPGSDLDILLILSKSHYSFKDRVTIYYPSKFPVPLDLFPYTEDEIKRMSGNHSIYKTAVETGIKIIFKL